MSLETVLQARRISKSFRESPVLRGVSFEIKRGEMVGLIGASGSGKSTLIRAIAGLTAIDRAEGHAEGEIRLFSQPIQQRGRVARCANALRARVGVVFQQFNLVPRLSVLTNVCLGLLGRMPLLPATFGQFSLEQKRRAMHALARVGIAEHALKRGCDLSGGQQQRAAIARAPSGSRPAGSSTTGLPPRSLRSSSAESDDLFASIDAIPAKDDTGVLDLSRAARTDRAPRVTA